MNIFYKGISILIIFIFLSILLLSYGISTDKFNKRIISNIEKNIPSSKAKIEKANVSLDLFSLGLEIKIKNPMVQIDNQDIKIESFKIISDLKSFFKNKYLLKKVEIKFYENEIRSLSNIQLFKDALISNGVKFNSGLLSGNLVITKFYQDKKFIKFSGKINDSSITIFKNLPSIKNLSANVSYDNNQISFSNVNGRLNKLKINSKNINYINDKRILNGVINLNGDITSFSDFKDILSKFILIDFKKLKKIKGQIKLAADLNINFDKNFKILKDQSNFNLITKNLDLIYFDNQDLEFKDINLSVDFDQSGKVYSKGQFKHNGKINDFLIRRKNKESLYDIDLNGIANIKEIFFKNKDFLIEDNLKYLIKIKLRSFEEFQIQAVLDLKNSEVDMPLFNYLKTKGVASKLTFSLIKNTKNVTVSKFNYLSNNDIFYIESLDLDNKFNIKNFDIINIKLGSKNKLTISKNKNNIVVLGETLDLTKLLKQRKRNKDFSFDLDISGSLRVDLTKIFLPDEELVNYKSSGMIKNGNIVKLNTFANFQDQTTFFHEVKKNNSGNTELIIKSDKAKPFLSNYSFLRGLDKGTLDIRRETISANLSITEVKIQNFYLKEMPILTNILSVASLTGALDVLEGKGIFFKEAYLKYQILNNELKIIECYGTGPSLGFVIEGRIGSDDYVSLQGSLAPANTINNIIRGIPVIGKVLTGKSGDGIFGASFKIKGTKNLQTEVNPIKTITPRFIQRFLSVFKK